MTRWDASTYDQAWERLRDAGRDPHGEVAFLERVFAGDLSIVSGPILDAGCGTGRVAIELARRGHDVVGTDIDAGMLEEAARKAPDIDWHIGNLATIELGQSFATVAMAGNVILFVEPGDRGAVIANLSKHLYNNGLLVAGFQLGLGRGQQVALEEWDLWTSTNDLVLVERYATWDEQPWMPGAGYAVSVHRRTGRHR